MSGKFHICEPSALKDLGFAASELDFLRRELRLGEGAIIVLADRGKNLHFLLSFSIIKSTRRIIVLILQVAEQNEKPDSGSAYISPCSA